MGHQQTVQYQKVVSDQVLHCLPTEFATYQIASSTDKGGKFHKAYMDKVIKLILFFMDEFGHDCKYLSFLTLTLLYLNKFKNC